MDYFSNIRLAVKIKVCSAFLLLALLHLTIQTEASALILQKPTSHSSNDTLVKEAIRKVLTSKTEMNALHYPKSVQRFYSQSDFQPAWIAPGNDIDKTWEALLLLDCVLQFGLNHRDYHPDKLMHSNMRDIIANPTKVDPVQKAWSDILLSDALIAFINHLHFGKLNPVYTKAIVDKGEISGFCADDILKQALVQHEFMKTVLNVQPKIKEYVLMQNYMKLLKGQYLDDCYEAPEGMVRKLAINMERLRWANINEVKYILINIPSYALKFYTPDTSYLFKVVVGKPATPTPVLQSLLTHFATAPDWKVPKKIFIKELLPKALNNPDYLENNHLAIYDLKGNYVSGSKENLLAIKKQPDGYYMRQSAGCDNALGLIVFRFQNTFDIYLHDTPERQLFDRKIRAFSHGCIRVQQAEKLATTLLNLDGQQQKIKVLHQAVANYRAKNFNLSAPIPLKITYLTCEIGEYGIIEYNDIYNKDKALESALYNEEKSNIPVD